jgi:hypothetical protein
MVGRTNTSLETSAARTHRFRTRAVLRADELPLRREFYAYAADVDRGWLTDRERWGSSDCRREFPGYPLLTKYFTSINFVGGEPLGLCWIHQEGDGGSIDPYLPVETLKQAMDS